MPQQRLNFDLPLRRTFNLSGSSINPLEMYISSSRTPAFDLPRQLSSNPYAQDSSSAANFVLDSRQNQSFSKCAATEISKHGDEQQSETLTTICHKLFNSDSYFEGDGAKKLVNQQVITEATFKPTDLKKYLAHSDHSPKGKQSAYTKQCYHKRLLSLNVKTQLSKKVISSKTKYQMLLDEHFNQKNKDKSQKLKMVWNKPHNNQLLCQENKPLRIHKQNQYTLYDQVQSNLQLQIKPPIIDRSKSQKTFLLKKSLPKTNSIDQPLIKRIQSESKLLQTTDRNKKIKNLDDRNNWMQLTFSERQARTIENRREKENIGLKISRQKQVKNCTFKPILTVFKPRILENKATSYAKIYYQKIRRKK